MQSAELLKGTCLEKMSWRKNCQCCCILLQMFLGKRKTFCGETKIFARECRSIVLFFSCYFPKYYGFYPVNIEEEISISKDRK